MDYYFAHYKIRKDNGPQIWVHTHTQIVMTAISQEMKLGTCCALKIMWQKLNLIAINQKGLKVIQYYVYMIQTIGKLPVHSQCPLYQWLQDDPVQ